MYKLFFDTETTGVNSKIHCPLTAFFAVCDPKTLNIIDELYVQMKPRDISKVMVEKEAMEVNKIDLKSHIEDPNTIFFEDAKMVLEEFFLKHKIQGKKKSLMPCGHNIKFDIDMLNEWVIPQEEWEKHVHYRTLDTSGICNFLKDVDIFPDDLGNLTSIVEYLGIPVSDAHTVKGDVGMNIEMYRRIIAMMKDKKNSLSGLGSESLLSIIEG